MSSTRLIYSLGFLICLSLLGFAFYLEKSLGLAPCQLCELQRLMMAAMGAVFFIAAIHNPARKMTRWVYIFFLCLFGALGFALASRQVWLIAHPPLAADAQCSASLTYLIQILPLKQALKIALMGTGDCAKVTWQFLSLSIPAWSALAFEVLLLLSIVTGVLKSGPRNEKG